MTCSVLMAIVVENSDKVSCHIHVKKKDTVDQWGAKLNLPDIQSRSPICLIKSTDFMKWDVYRKIDEPSIYKFHAKNAHK